jgi:hypothetical protein
MVWYHNVRMFSRQCSLSADKIMSMFSRLALTVSGKKPRRKSKYIRLEYFK